MRTRFRISLLAGLAALVVALGAFVVSGAPTRSVLAQEPPPRPTLTPAPPTAQPTAKPQERERDRPTAVALSGRITGTVIDLATGAPASGVSVRVGDAIVVTDSNGNYDRPGLPAGSYVVALVLSEGTAPAQEPITLQLGSAQTVIQHLAFRPAAAVATAAPAPAPQPAMPTELPATSGERSSTLVLRAIVGLLLLSAGVMGRLLLRRRVEVGRG
jgi:hypothetical protein